MATHKKGISKANSKPKYTMSARNVSNTGVRSSSAKKGTGSKGYVPPGHMC